jgi:hypothetical protein
MEAMENVGRCLRWSRHHRGCHHHAGRELEENQVQPLDASWQRQRMAAPEVLVSLSRRVEVDRSETPLAADAGHCAAAQQLLHTSSIAPQLLVWREVLAEDRPKLADLGIHEDVGDYDGGQCERVRTEAISQPLVVAAIRLGEVFLDSSVGPNHQLSALPPVHELGCQARRQRQAVGSPPSRQASLIKPVDATRSLERWNPLCETQHRLS